MNREKKNGDGELKRFQWPPKTPELGEIVKEYIDSGLPLSIADRSGVYGELEDEFARRHNKKFALLTSSGTMALYSAFFALKLRPGDEVICTAFSYHATAAPLLHFGVKICFCDVEPDTGNLNAELLPSLLSSRTVAVVTNDQWGHPVDKKKVVSFCKKHNLAYVEDCSHAHFSEYEGKYTGTFGDVACWSLQGNKLLSAGEGGILLTDDREIYERAVLLGHNLKRPKVDVKNPAMQGLLRTGFGLKLRIHPLAALMALYYLKNNCESWIESRQDTLEYFQNGLKAETPLLPMAKRPYVTSMGAWYGFKPRCNFQALNLKRTHLVDYMKEKGFNVKIPGSDILPSYELFRNAGNYFPDIPPQKVDFQFPGATIYSQSILSLPTFTFEEDRGTIDKYISEFKQYFKEYSNV